MRLLLDTHIYAWYANTKFPFYRSQGLQLIENK